MTQIDEKAQSAAYDAYSNSRSDDEWQRIEETLKAYEAAKASEQPVGISSVDAEVERILEMTDDEVIAEAGGAENAKIVADHVRRIFDKAKIQVEIAKAIHYPDCWDTIAYPTLFDAMNELAGCVGCSECRHAGKNPDADQRPMMRESVDLEKYEVLARTIESIHGDAECLLKRARNEGVGKTSAINICSEIARKCRAIRHLYKDWLFSLSKIEDGDSK